MQTEDPTQIIRKLNDDLRKTLTGGQIVMTCGVRAEGDKTVRQLLAMLQAFDDWEGNDTYLEHDFGCIKHNGKTYFWKIDYYDKRLFMHSPDPADPDVTCRVLTIMLAEEY